MEILIYVLFGIGVCLLALFIDYSKTYKKKYDELMDEYQRSEDVYEKKYKELLVKYVRSEDAYAGLRMEFHMTIIERDVLKASYDELKDNKLKHKFIDNG